MESSDDTNEAVIKTEMNTNNPNASNETGRKNEGDDIFDSKQTETTLQRHLSEDATKIGDNSEATISSGDQGQGATNISDVTPNENQIYKSNALTQAPNLDEHEGLNRETKPSKYNELKRKAEPNTSSRLDDLDRSDSSNVSYISDESDLLEVVSKTKITEKLIDRLLGCAYGQALGDAYGLSTEFETRERVAYNYPDLSQLIPFPDYLLTGHSRRWTKGDWTDDTDQWILILETLTGHHDGKSIEEVFAKKLISWIRNGYPELGDYGGLGLGTNVSQVNLILPWAFQRNK